MKQANRRGLPVQVPKCITEYNAGVLGVDLADWKTQKYRVGIKSKKWYFSLVTHCLDVAVVNSYILYNLLHPKEKIDLLDFRVYVTTVLLKTDSNSKPKKTGVRVPRLPQPLNLIGEKNELMMGSKRKCKVCKKNARKQCGQCNLGFHVQCFEAYHSY